MRGQVVRVPLPGVPRTLEYFGALEPGRSGAARTVGVVDGLREGLKYADGDERLTKSTMCDVVILQPAKTRWVTLSLCCSRTQIVRQPCETNLERLGPLRHHPPVTLLHAPRELKTRSICDVTQRRQCP